MADEITPPEQPPSAPEEPAQPITEEVDQDDLLLKRMIESRYTPAEEALVQWWLRRPVHKPKRVPAEERPPARVIKFLPGDDPDGGGEP